MSTGNKLIRRRWVTPDNVGKSGFYWNTSDSESQFRRLVRVYRKSETNVWIEDQNGCRSTIEGTGYYLGPYPPDSILFTAKKHPEYDTGQLLSKPPLSNWKSKIKKDVPAHGADRDLVNIIHAESNIDNKMDMDQITKRGFQDALNGLDFMDNPFNRDDEDSERYHAWFTGWSDAQDVVDCPGMR